MINKNKRAMLLAEETLKMVISVIAIGFLIYFLVSLYFSNQDAQKQVNAEGTLNKIQSVLDSPNQEASISAITPGGWTVFSFTEEFKPNQCNGKECICICSEVWRYGVSTIVGKSREERQAEECSDNGECLKVNNLKSFKPIYIEDSRTALTNIKVIKSEEGVEIKQLK